jgi:hypothetical protein
MCDYNNATPNPCRSATWGEAEDYTINVSGGVPPSPSFASVAWSPATFLNSTTLAVVTASAVTSTTTYTVTGTDANGCTSTSSVTLTVSPAPMGNTQGTAIAATLPYTTSGDNLAANCWSSEYVGANAQSSPDVFYQFTMPNCNDSVVVSLCGSGFDTYLHLLDNSGTQIAFNDDGCSTSSIINFGGLTPGATYYAVVEGFSSNTGTFNLSINTYQGSTVTPLVTATATPSTTCNNTVVIPVGGGATSYVWSGGLTDNTPFVATTGSTTYTVTGTDALGCTGTSTVNVVVNAASGTLAPATSNQSQNHADDFGLSYYDALCNLIASVDDGAGGNILGNTVATVNVDANAGTHNGQPFVRRWYQITPSSNVGVSATVTLYIEQADFTNYNTAVVAPYLMLPTTGSNADPNVGNIRITKNSDGGLGNMPEVITPTVNWNGMYWELTFPVTGFSQFRVHSVNPGNVPLPVSITKFDGRKLNSSDMLEWTGSEQNNAYFNLQHSTNGVDFKTIGKVNSKAANGTSQTALNYSYEHSTPSLGHNYYRLEQVDIDGKASMHAKVVDLIWGANGSTVSLYPNPTQDVLNIDLYTSKVQNTTVKVLDMSGRVVKQMQARSEAGMNSLSISLGELASGVYTVQVYDNDKLSHVGKVKKN